MKEAQGLTRTQLYEAVWTEPIYRLAPRCGVTDVGMAKLCRRYRIPVPGRGYWRKLETGGTVPKRPSLPRSPDLEADAVIARLRDPEVPVEPSKPLVALAIDAASLHPVAASAWARLKRTRPNREDVLDAGYLGLKIMPDALQRAVLIVDALAKEFGARGCEINSDEKGIGVVSRGPDSVSFELTQDPVTLGSALYNPLMAKIELTGETCFYPSTCEKVLAIAQKLRTSMAQIIAEKFAQVCRG